jgi:hypothetical protein
MYKKNGVCNEKIPFARACTCWTLWVGTEAIDIMIVKGRIFEIWTDIDRMRQVGLNEGRVGVYSMKKQYVSKWT